MYLVAGSHENLLASIRNFAQRASSVGIGVTLEVSEGMQHAYVYMAGRAIEDDETIQRVGLWLREEFGK